MKAKHLLTSDQKLENWGYGEWVEEPDLIEFEHTGFECRVQRIFHRENSKILFGGHLCGYICVNEGHPWHGLIAKELSPEASVHGGITYAAQNKDGYWIGFDCAHFRDLLPSMVDFRKRMYQTDERFKKIKDAQMKLESQFSSSAFFKETYRNIEYVVKECKSLAEQAHALIENNS